MTSTIRTVVVGGLTRSELREELRRAAIALNDAAEQLLASPQFSTSAARSSLTTIELAVGDLGFTEGATTAEIMIRAGALGLGYCPIELGPHLRLQVRDQPEGHWGQPERRHQAPSGSITIVSKPLGDDDEFPKGFYLRRIKGELWLRGYRSGPEHVWRPEDRLVFRRVVRARLWRGALSPRGPSTPTAAGERVLGSITCLARVRPSSS